MADQNFHGNLPGQFDDAGYSSVAAELDRLEDVGDLHFDAAAYSTALDYYGRILPADVLIQRSDRQALCLLRKALTACLHLGWSDRADALLARARAHLEAIDISDDATHALELARIQVRAAVLMMQRADYQGALEVAKSAFAVLALTDQHVEVANLQLTMGASHQSLGRLEKAEEFYLDSLSTYRRVGDEVGVATLYNALALLHKAGCRWSKSLQLLDKAINLATAHGATQLLAGFELNRGIVLSKTGRFGEARQALSRSLELSRSLGDRIREPKILLALGRLDLLTGRLARAEEHLIAGQALAERERMVREVIIADEYLGDVLLARGNGEAAALNYDLGLAKVEQLGRAGDLEGELLRRRAEARRRADDLPNAIADAHAAVAVCEACGEDYELGFAHQTLGQSYAMSADWSLADVHFRQAVELFQSQHLLREWCGAVRAFLDARLESADKPVLLLLRRQLLDVQEHAAEAGDEFLAASLEGLAQVQLRLGLCDDALLTVFELERVACGLEDEACLSKVVQLRQLVDAGLTGGVDSDQSPARILARIPGLFQAGDARLTQHMDTVLTSVCQRAGATCGFLALANGDGLRATARLQLDENLASQLIRWFEAQPTVAQDLRYHSRLGPESALLQAVPALRGRIPGCLFLPITDSRRSLGLLFLGLNGEQADPGFDRQTLDDLTNSMGFLALFLAEKNDDVVESTVDAEHEGFGNLITNDPRMHEMLGLVRKVADSELTVLLQGETGTGKGMLAYAVHALSRRVGRHFQAINCAAIPETLLESELFGHVKGAFTGADADKNGLLLDAEGGTVFLDEVGKMSIAMQGKLLHFMDTKVVRPVGSSESRQVDVRIVCATKTDLQDLVASDRFLEDLYFRLLDFPVSIPPLRQRGGDVRLLAQHFLQKYGSVDEHVCPDMGSDVLDALEQYDWPGNIRELEKCIQRALVLARGEERLRLEHLPRHMTPFVTGGGRCRVLPLRETMATVESREIARALKACRGNKSAAARLLQISYPNLLKKVKLYALDG